jgi:O-antigen ligase
MAALFVVWLLIDWHFERKTPARHGLYAVAISAAVFAVIWSGSRGAYVSLGLMLLVWALLYVKARWVFASLIVVIGITAISYSTSDIVRSGVDRANQEYYDYFQIKNPATYKNNLSSVGTRLEMIRATQYFFKDAPVLGVGPGNYQQKAREYAEQHLVHREISNHGHPHNAFLEALFSKGLVGLLSLLVMLFYPLVYFLLTYKQSRQTAALGTMHIVGMSAFMLTDASPILMNNFTSVLLLPLAVVFAWHKTILRSNT